VIPFRQDVANERDATINAERAPDWSRDFFFKPLLEILRARMMPMTVRTMSVAGTAAGSADSMEDDWREVEVG